MLAGRVQVAKKGEFRHTVFRNRHFEVILGKLAEIPGLKFTLMDAIGRQIRFKMTYGLLGTEKQGFSGSRDPDITFGSHGREMSSGGSSGNRGFRREGAHPMGVLCLPERLQVAEIGEFRHTDSGKRYFGAI